MKAIPSPPLPVWAARRRPKSNARSDRRRPGRHRPGVAHLRDRFRVARLSPGVEARRRALRLRAGGSDGVGAIDGATQRARLCPGAHGLRVVPQAGNAVGVPGPAAGGGDHPLATSPGDGAALPAPLTYSATTRSLPVRFAVSRFSSARLEKEKALSSSGRYAVTPALTVRLCGGTPCVSSPNGLLRISASTRSATPRAVS